MMTNTLTWGLLSTARINRRLVGPINQASRSEMVAVASRSRDTARKFVAKWDIPRMFASYEAMLASQSISTIYIPLPNSMHCEWVIKAAQAGKHILCEKPLALTVDEVDQMVQVAEENKVCLLEAFAYRTHPQIAKLKEVIAEGLIGEVKVIRSSFSFTLQNLDDIRMKRLLGGGSLWDVGCYPISLAQAVVGADPVEVFGWQTLGGDGVDVVFAGQLKYENGTIAQISCGFDLPYQVGAEIVGNKGRIYVGNPWHPDVDDKPSGLLHIAPDDTQTHIPIDIKEDPYLSQVQALERAVLDGEPLPYTLAQSRGNIATIQALYQSAVYGEVVRIGE